MLRTEAGLKLWLERREIVREATGSPVSIYACTIECKIAECRACADCLFISFRQDLKNQLFLLYETQAILIKIHTPKVRARAVLELGASRELQFSHEFQLLQ